MTDSSTTAKISNPHPLMRRRDGHHARVTFEELFLDLVYVFAVTQLSHELLTNLNLIGFIETLILWFAVWLGWQYTCWVTNWFDPETTRIRSLIFAIMLVGLVMASAIPGDFGERGFVFAFAYVAIQVGRTAYIVWEMGPGSSPYIKLSSHARMDADCRRLLDCRCLCRASGAHGAVGDCSRLRIHLANVWPRPTGPRPLENQ